ncbi:TorD/DmsD family molecular chaperone [Halodurantibacterium flavum]|uniref:Molecular chaperone n=1 Tax=Halodurantibacterium flavum TaxID=1382802 RepID=A0ABW4S9I7_9RHOB
MTSASRAQAGQAVSQDDLLRAQQYGFIARLLSQAPDAAILDDLRRLDPDAGTPLGQAYAALAEKAATADPKRVEREFFELFIGVGRGELLPYASFYLTGFLNERPLADLRGDLRLLGLERAPGRHEPEDNIAFLCEVMAGLATGEFGARGLDDQVFFTRHLAPWAGQFFDDLAAAPSTDFYAPVAGIGRLFIEIERRAFALAP